MVREGGSYLNKDGKVTQVEAPTKPHPDGNRARPDNSFPKAPKKKKQTTAQSSASAPAQTPAPAKTPDDGKSAGKQE